MTMKNNYLTQLRRRYAFLPLAIFFSLITSSSFACDTSPVVTASNVQNIGGGFFTIDVQVCIGINGSIDGYDLSMNCGLNITATSAATQNNGGNIATASITGGVLTYTYSGAGDFEPDDGISGPCFNQTITVDGDPLGCTVTSTGINDGCLIISTSWSATIPGPCFADHTISGAGSVVGSTVGAGNNCTLRSSEDQIIEVSIPCDDTWTFSLCGNATWDTYLYLSSSCCGPSISLNDDACSLQSEISTALTTGVYYITVEAFSSSTTGTYTLDISSANPCTVLPIGLTEFSGYYSEYSRSNELTWVTDSETNNDYFVLERSADGINFGAIADIDGQGDSYIENTYTYFDPIESSDTYYYRLKQFDFDGASSYSDVIAIESEWDNSEFFRSLFPNPAKTKINLVTSQRIKKDPIQLTFINAQGSVVKTQELMGYTNAANYGIDVSTLNSGVYTVQLVSGDESEVRKIVIL